MEYCDGMMYAVKKGDTLYSISMKYNIPLVLLLRANPYVDVYNLQVGETICIPVKNEQSCQYPRGGSCVWERRENEEETGMENASGEGRSWRESRQETVGEVEKMKSAGGCCSGMMQKETSMSGNMSEDASGSQGMTGMGDHMEMSENREEVEETMDVEGKNLEKDNNFQWERYVTQPGDTLDIAVGGSSMENGRDWEDILEDFVEKNGMNQIYLLPGIAYYRQK